MTSNPWWEGLPGFEELGDDRGGADRVAQFKAHLEAMDKEKQARLKTGLTAREVYEAWLAESKRSEDDALTTGWPSIDGALGRPMLPGEVVILGARTGVGKTWVAQHLGERAMQTEHHRVAFVSMEMSYYQLGERYAAHALNVNPNIANERAKAGELTAEGLAAETIGADRWWFYERSIGVEEMSEVVESAAEAMGAPPTIVILDYLGLLAGKGKLYERTSDNARALKDAAKATNTIIVCAAQISRQVGGSGEEEPTLAGMRDSGAIEEAADRAFLFWGVKDSPNEIMCRLAKNRYGEKSDGVYLKFDDAMRLKEHTDMYASDVPF